MFPISNVNLDIDVFVIQLKQQNKLHQALSSLEGIDK